MHLINVHLITKYTWSATDYLPLSSNSGPQTRASCFLAATDQWSPQRWAMSQMHSKATGMSQSKLG